jgi:hypothetical protein
MSPGASAGTNTEFVPQIGSGQSPMMVIRSAFVISERLGGLKDCHAAAVQRAATQRARGAQQFSLNRKVNDLGNPKVRAQQGCGARQTGVLRHADRCRVYQPVCGCQGVGDFGRVDYGYTIRAETHCTAFRYCLGAFGYSIDDCQLLDAARKRRMRDGRTRAAGAQLHDVVAWGIRQAASEIFREAKPVRIVANPLAIL